MGSGRTLRKDSHVRPCKSEGQKHRRIAAQRRHLVKYGLAAADVDLMTPEAVRTLVQRPAVIKKMLAKKAAK